MAIDIGAAAINRAAAPLAGNTYIALDNPANEAGIITTVEIWANTNLEGCKVGTFYGTPPDFTCRDYETIGNVTAGSKQTFSGLSIDCEIDDYIGIYYASGKVEADASGYAGVYLKVGDQFDAGQQEYSLYAGDTISVYGFGVVDTTIVSPLVTGDSEGNIPSLSLGLGVLPPLTSVSGEALISSFVLDRIFGSPLVAVDSLALTPNLVLDVIFSSPLTTVDSDGLTPTIHLSLTLFTPLVSTDSEALVAILNLGIKLLPPVVVIDSAGLVPSLVLDKIFGTPLVVVTSKAPTPFERDTGHLTIVVPLTDIEELGFVPAVAAAIQRVLTAPANLRVITLPTKRATQTPASLRKVDR